jgi:hypothetical protein
MFSILNAERIVFIPVDDCQQRCFQCSRLREDRSFRSGEREMGAGSLRRQIQNLAREIAPLED